MLAALVAAPSALSFAELASRMPTSAGEATGVKAGLRLPGLPLLVGLMVVIAGIASAAAIANAFHGYLQPLLDVPRAPTIIAVFVLLATLAIWGIAESVTLAITTLLYAAIAGAAVLVVPPAILAGSGEPLALVYETSGGPWPRIINTIAIVAVLNGALIQIIMASRVLYGPARQGSLPATLGHAWAPTRTPVAATLLVAGAAMAFALWLPLARLAEIAAITTLCTFAIVNLALIGLSRRADAPAGAWRAPRWAPWAGFACAAGVRAFDAVRPSARPRRPGSPSGRGRGSAHARHACPRRCSPSRGS